MLTLFIKDNCKYSRAALEKLAELALPFTEKNIKDVAVVDELFTLGGKIQVPYLVDDEKQAAMYGSDDIIAFLDAEYGKGSATAPAPAV